MQNPTKPKMAVISATNHYNERAKEIINFHKNEYDVTYVTSDFDHIRKERYKCNVENSVQLHVIAYYKNISVERIMSHILFSVKTLFLLMKIKPEKVYAEIPNNTLALTMSLYKLFSKCELIFDVFDMWPESFPNKSQNVLFKIAMDGWRWTRNGFLKNADQVWIECDYYRELLALQGIDIPMQTHYLVKTAKPLKMNFQIETEKMNIVYVGSINNVTDVNLIVDLLAKIQQKQDVVLHLVGAGETLDDLTKRLREKNVEVICYGIVYEQNELQCIFDKCSFAINIIKEDLAIGITMKSVTYFMGGMPILNTVPGDTEKFVKQENVGVNIYRENLDDSIDCILALSVEDVCQMKHNAVALYEKKFYQA